MEVILPILAIIGVLLIWVFLFKGIFNGKTHSKMMEKQMDLMKDMTTGDMGERLKKLSSTAINIRKSVLEENVDALKEMAEMEANIQKGAIKTKAQAVKEGFMGENTIFCKHCGAMIDSDSKFCKKCGKEQ